MSKNTSSNSLHNRSKRCLLQEGNEKVFFLSHKFLTKLEKKAKKIVGMFNGEHAPEEFIIQSKS